MKTRVDKVEIQITIDNVRRDHQNYRRAFVEIERYNPSTHVWQWRPYYPGIASLTRLIKVTAGPNW